MSKTEHRAPNELWGPAITYTRIDDEGKMWAGNDEYETQVNYCPFTGNPAPKQMTLKDVPYMNYREDINNPKEVYIKEYINERESDL